jgi:hypothetical protein
MANIRFLSDAVRIGTIMINGIFVYIVFVLGLLCFSADIGTEEAQSLAGLCALFEIALIVIIAALIVSNEHRLMVQSAYTAAAFFLVASLRSWYSVFNLFGTLSPPLDAMVEGALAILNLTALVLNRPIHYFMTAPQTEPES